MSGYQTLGLILQRNGMTEKFNHLFSSQLISGKYPDKFLTSWNVHPIHRTKDELFQILYAFEKGDEVNYIKTSKYNDFDNDPLLHELIELDVACTQQDGDSLVLEPFGISFELHKLYQGFWGNSSEELTFQLCIPNSYGHHHFFNYQTRFALQKTVEILQPKYMWSDYTSDSLYNCGLHSQDQKYELQGKSTQVFSEELLLELGVSASEITSNQNIYYSCLLQNSMLWVSSPIGFGNQLPFTSHIQFNSKEGFNTYTDSSLSHFFHYHQQTIDHLIERSNTKHIEAIRSIFKI